MLKGNQSFLTSKGNGDEWDIRSLLMRRDGKETSSTFGSKCLIPYRNARQKFVPCKKPISPASFLHSIQDHLTCGISIANFKVMISRTNTIFFWEQQIHCQHVSPFNTFFFVSYICSNVSGAADSHSLPWQKIDDFISFVICHCSFIESQQSMLQCNRQISIHIG